MTLRALSTLAAAVLFASVTPFSGVFAQDRRRRITGSARGAQLYSRFRTAQICLRSIVRRMSVVARSGRSSIPLSMAGTSGFVSAMSSERLHS